jgi:hypothetical protein
MPRPYTCTQCGQVRETNARRGPLPRICAECVEAEEAARPAAPVQPVRKPRKPPTAPSPLGMLDVAALESQRAHELELAAAMVPPAYAAPEPLPAQPPPPLPPYEPGFLETTLQAELSAMTSTNPAAKTLAASAMAIARAADMADPSDLKQVLAANKELRATIEAITKYQGGDDDEQSLFGAVRPEVVDAPAV